MNIAVSESLDRVIRGLEGAEWQDDSVIRRAFDAIRSLPFDALSVERVCKDAHIKASAVQRHLHTLQAPTLKPLLDELRMDAGKQLLANTHEKQEVIAREIGLRDAHALRRLFRRRDGTLPSYYRPMDEDRGEAPDQHLN